MGAGGGEGVAPDGDGGGVVGGLEGVVGCVVWERDGGRLVGLGCRRGGEAGEERKGGGGGTFEVGGVGCFGGGEEEEAEGRGDGGGHGLWWGWRGCSGDWVLSLCMLKCERVLLRCEVILLRCETEHSF